MNVSQLSPKSFTSPMSEAAFSTAATNSIKHLGHTKDMFSVEKKTTAKSPRSFVKAE